MPLPVCPKCSPVAIPGHRSVSAEDGLRSAWAVVMMSGAARPAREGGEMSRITRPPLTKAVKYPTRDGRPTAETELHGLLMIALIQTLREYFRRRPRVYVWGNLLVFYERGNRRKHVSPDVF